MTSDRRVGDKVVETSDLVFLPCGIDTSYNDEVFASFYEGAGDLDTRQTPGGDAAGRDGRGTGPPAPPRRCGRSRSGDPASCAHPLCVAG